MTVILEQFVQTLRESGLMTAEEIDSFLVTLPLEERPKTSEELAKALVRRHKLTKFQAQAIYQGKTRGLVVGNYLVLEKLGQGGMGYVYKAQHKRMHRVVALKVLPSAVAKDPEAVQRFQREVDAAAQLSHPNIITAYDADEAEGVHFLVMEYVEGQDLGAWVRGHGPLPVRKAVDYILQAAKGLEYAHNKKVIHRDIKPSNLLLDKEGTVKVLDMGLARFDQELGGNESTAAAGLTQAGQVMGTIDYMSPEQSLDTHSADGRADIYSLGCTLFYLLLGRPVYGGETLTKKILAHREEAIPSLRALRPEVPQELDAVFRKMVAKQAKDRFRSMREVIAALEPCRTIKPQQVAETISLKQPAENEIPVGRPFQADSDGPEGPSYTRAATGRPRGAPTGAGDTDKQQAESVTAGGDSGSGGLGIEDWLNAELPSVPTMLRPLPRRKVRVKREYVLYGSVAAGVAFLVLLLGIVLKFRTSEGTLVVEVNQPGAEVSVDDGKVTIKSPGDNQPVQVQVAEGKHTLLVKKGGFEAFTKEFTIRSGGKETIKAKLEPTPDFANIQSGQPSSATPPASRDKPVEPSRAVVSSSETPPTAIAPFSADRAKQHQEAWAKHLGIPVEDTNSIGMKLVLIPPGEFEMGSTPEEIAWALEEGKKYRYDQTPWYRETTVSEGPRHRVRMTKPFYLATYLVTQGEYEKVMGVNPSAFCAKQMDASAFKPPLTEDGKEGRERDGKRMAGKDTSRHPVETVSWNDCMEFCRKLSALPAEQAAKRVYRLPTEAEWEYACRAGTTTRWYCGDDEEGLLDYAWFGEKRINSGKMTHPVGEKKPNAWGLYDMHGNASQWCADWFSLDYYKRSPSDDPMGPPDGDNRVARSGSWGLIATLSRAACRTHQWINYRTSGVGFRVVCEIAGKTEASKQPTTPAPATYGPNAPPPAVAPFDAAKAKEHQEAWAKHLDVPVEHTNTLGMKFILIPPGEFMMGSTPAEIEEALKVAGDDKHWQECVKSEAPQHKVILTQPIYLGVHEVTQAQYEKVLGQNPSHFAATGPGKDAVVGVDTSTCPAEMVSWNNAAEFCAKLSEKEKLKPFYVRAGETVAILDGAGYRLPTEAEWEFACRAGTTTKYWTGDKDDELVRAAWFGTNSGGRTHAVGELKANPFGLFDIHGNVWEWIQDGWEPTYYGQFQEKPALDPNGPSIAGSLRLLRGTAWAGPASECRASYHRANDPATSNPYIGFRVALVVEAVKQAIKDRDARPANSTTGWQGWPKDAPPPAIAPFDAEKANAHQAAWAKYLGVPVETTNSIGMKLALIPPGEFMMGSTQEEVDQLLKEAKEKNYEPWYKDRLPGEAPQHRVRITKPFYLGVTEVTQEEYQRVTGSNPSDWRGDTKRPVEQVSWDDATEFCRRLTESPEEKGPKRQYRLPTEAQWEYACRAGNLGPRFFSPQPRPLAAGEEEKLLAEYGWFVANSGGQPHPVGQKRVSAWGLYDVYGNVWEWCQDWYDVDYYAKSARDDPSGPTRGSHRVLRGGGFDMGAGQCRSAQRLHFQPGFHACLGFRVCLILADK